MKQYLIPLIFLLNFCLLQGQNTFNIRDRYGFEACTLSGIISTDSCYYAMGIIADIESSQLVVGSIFLKLDFQGNPLTIKTIKGPGRTYETWFPSFTQTNDGAFYNVGSTYDTTTSTFIAKYNADGDTVFIKQYLSPYSPIGTFIKPWGGLSHISDGGLGILCSIGTSNDPFENDANYYLIRTDSLGNKLWAKIYATPFWERPNLWLPLRMAVLSVGVYVPTRLPMCKISLSNAISSK